MTNLAWFEAILKSNTTYWVNEFAARRRATLKINDKEMMWYSDKIELWQCDGNKRKIWNDFLPNCSDMNDCPSK